MSMLSSRMQPHSTEEKAGAFEVIETVRKHFVVVERPLPVAD